MPKKTTKKEERVRFCDNCNAVIGWYATFCDECGLKVGEQGPGASAGPSAAEGETPYGELFRAHLRLLHRYRERSEVLRKRGQRLGKALDRESSRRGDAGERRLRLVGLSERLLEMEEEWGELQHSYNRQSEAIEEDFVAANEELELDVELPPEMQEALEAEVQAFLHTLEGIQLSLSLSGEELDRALARERSRVFGLPTGGDRPVWILAAVSAALLLVAGALLWLGRGLSATDAALAVGPGLLVVVVWTLFARSR